MSVTLVYITAPNFEEAERIARGLVENRLAACANIIPRIVSTYWWDDRVHETEETLVIVKTAGDLVDRVMLWTKENHTYEVPAILAINTVDGDADFVNWLHAEVRKK